MWQNEDLGFGKGGISPGRHGCRLQYHMDTVCRACGEETQNGKGKIKGQELKYFLCRWPCLNFLRHFSFMLLPTASFKWHEKLWSLFVFVQETDCSNSTQLKTFFFCFATNHNNIFYTYITAFSLGSRRHLQRSIWPLSFPTRQQEAAVPFCHQDNWGTRTSCYPVAVAEGGSRIRSGIHVPWLPDPRTRRDHIPHLWTLFFTSDFSRSLPCTNNKTLSGLFNKRNRLPPGTLQSHPREHAVTAACGQTRRVSLWSPVCRDANDHLAQRSEGPAPIPSQVPWRIPHIPHTGTCVAREKQTPSAGSAAACEHAESHPSLCWQLLRSPKLLLQLQLFTFCQNTRK